MTSSIPKSVDVADGRLKGTGRPPPYRSCRSAIVARDHEVVSPSGLREQEQETD